eukprot:gene27243-biopygen5491
MEKPKLSSTEFNSLHDFYNATNGPLWRWHNVSVQSTHWNFSIPGVNPCLDDWQGHMPDSMENFSKMSQLILRGNNITGTIAQSIGNMTELEILDLSYNGLYGEIPSSIGRLSKLITLNL